MLALFSIFAEAGKGYHQARPYYEYHAKLEKIGKTKVMEKISVTAFSSEITLSHLPKAARQHFENYFAAPNIFANNRVIGIFLLFPLSALVSRSGISLLRGLFPVIPGLEETFAFRRKKRSVHLICYFCPFSGRRFPMALREQNRFLQLLQR